MLINAYDHVLAGTQYDFGFNMATFKISENGENIYRRFSTVTEPGRRPT